MAQFLNSPFSSDVAFVCLGSEFEGAKLHPEEEELLSAKAIDRRRYEFTLGRTAARMALEDLGISSPPAIGRGDNREPIWPDGIIGSITHSSGIAAAVATTSEKNHGIGIDLESLNRPSKTDITDRVASVSESQWIREVMSESNKRTLMLFSAKEALFKALYPLYKQYFWYHQAELNWNEKKGVFLAKLDFSPDPTLPVDTEYEIRVQFSENFVFSSLLV